MSGKRWIATITALGAFSLVHQVYTAAQTPASPTASAGDVTRGEAIFAGKGNCLSCHRAGDRGSRMGPDLSSVGSDHTPQEIEKALLQPGSEVRAQFRLYRVTTKAGKAYTGRLMNQDLTSIQMMDTEGRLRAFRRAEVSDASFITTPPMPSYADKLSRAEQVDLLAYLNSLKGVVRQ